MAVAAVLFLFAFRFVAFWVNSLAYVSLATRLAYQTARIDDGSVGWGEGSWRNRRLERKRPALQWRKFVFGMRMRHHNFVARLWVSGAAAMWVSGSQEQRVRFDLRVCLSYFPFTCHQIYFPLSAAASCRPPLLRLRVHTRVCPSGSILFIFSLLPLRSSRKHNMLLARVWFRFWIRIR